MRFIAEFAFIASKASLPDVKNMLFLAVKIWMGGKLNM